MKSITIKIAVILIVVNFLLGLMLSAYESFNIWMNCGVIIFNTVLIWLLNQMRIKDGFRYSLGVLFPIFALIEFLCIAFSKPQLEDNGAAIFVLFLWVLQVVLLLAANRVSKTIE